MKIKDRITASYTPSNKDLAELNIGIRIKIKKKTNEKLGYPQMNAKKINPKFIRRFSKANSVK